MSLAEGAPAAVPRAGVFGEGAALVIVPKISDKH